MKKIIAKVNEEFEVANAEWIQHARILSRAKGPNTGLKKKVRHSFEAQPAINLALM